MSRGLSIKINIYTNNKKYFYIFCLIKMMGGYDPRAKLNFPWVYLENGQ